MAALVGLAALRATAQIVVPNISSGKVGVYGTDGSTINNNMYNGFSTAFVTAANAAGLFEELVSAYEEELPRIAEAADATDVCIKVAQTLDLKLKEGENYALIDKLHKTARFEGARDVITIDGLRVEYPDGFGLARASNTTPVIVLRFEGDNAAALAFYLRLGLERQAVVVLGRFLGDATWLQ